MYQRVFAGHASEDEREEPGPRPDTLAPQAVRAQQEPQFINLDLDPPNTSTQGAQDSEWDLLGIESEGSNLKRCHQAESFDLLPLEPDDNPRPKSLDQADAAQAPFSSSHPQQPPPLPSEYNEGEPDDPEQLLDFEQEDGSTSHHRELLLYALPLHQDDTDPVRGLVFLPVSNFHDEDDYDGVSGKMREKLDKLQSKVASKWDELKAKEKDSVGGKVYKVGHKVVNNLTPQERLTRSIPKNVTKVIIYHPACIPPDVIMERLSSITTDHGVLSTAKAAVATVMLPLAFGIDILIIPGPQVLTWYTGYQIYKNVNSVVGNKRLTKYIAQSGEAKHVRVNYAGDVRLDEYWEEVQHSHDGVLDEEACMQLVNDIEQPDLLEPLLELRRRWLKEQGEVSSKGHKYQALRGSEYTAN